MNKILRNTLFTLVVILATALVVHYQKQDKKEDKTRTLEGEQVRASRGDPSLTLGSDAGSSIKLKVSFKKPVLKLGQSQVLEIETVPSADLKIITIYPNGSVNNPQTIETKADETGKYTLQFKISDYQFLGTFVTHVRSTAGEESTQTSNSFLVQRWIDPTPSVSAEPNFSYPFSP